MQIESKLSEIKAGPDRESRCFRSQLIHREPHRFRIFCSIHRYREATRKGTWRGLTILHSNLMAYRILHIYNDYGLKYFFYRFDRYLTQGSFGLPLKCSTKAVVL